jgi:RNA polymerase sigma-70 factor (ECF subfamily)
VVALRFFAELSLEEIAATTGRPVNTVKTHLRRGLERLRPLLGHEVTA